MPVITGFSLRSPAFEDNAPIPDKFTGKGENASPALNWFNPPPATAGFALVVDDPDAPFGTFTHWIVYNLPKDAISIPEAAGRAEVLPNGGRQLQNDFKKIGYDGPMPPPGKVHHYVFTLYALDKLLDAPISGKKALLAAIAGHVQGKAALIGTYRR
jgi:hypothetical protein